MNDDVFAWDDLPRRVAVFGPGVIGLELGQALARLGVEVRVFGVSGSLGGISDPLVRQSARKIFQREFYLDPDARVLETRRVGDEVEVRYVALDNSERTERFDYALVATGRRPNVDGLGLEHTSLALNRQGVPLFDRETMQAGDAPIFIAGDANADARRCCTRPPTRGASPARTPRAIPMCAPVCGARRWQWCSRIRRSRWPDRATRGWCRAPSSPARWISATRAARG